MAVQNTLVDLNNHLFAQLERLGDEELKGEQLAEEINRAKSISDIATQVISNGVLALKAETFKQEYCIENKADRKLPPMLKASLLKE